MENDVNKLQLKPKGRRPYFFDEPAVDKLLSIVMALAGEVSVMHDEYDTLTRMLDEKGIISKQDLQKYLPDAAVRAERDQWRESFLDNVLRIIHQEVEGLREIKNNEKDAESSYDEAVDYVEHN